MEINHLDIAKSIRKHKFIKDKNKIAFSKCVVCNKIGINSLIKIINTKNNLKYICLLCYKCIKNPSKIVLNTLLIEITRYEIGLNNKINKF